MDRPKSAMNQPGGAGLEAPFPDDFQDPNQDSGAAVAEKAKELAASVKDKSKELAAAMAQAAGDMASTAAHRTKDAAARVVRRIGDKAEETTSAVGTGIESLGHSIREQGPQEGVMAAASSAVAGTLENSGRYLQQQGLEGIGQDVTKMIRRYPIQSVLIGIGIGFLLARTIRR